MLTFTQSCLWELLFASQSSINLRLPLLIIFLLPNWAICYGIMWHTGENLLQIEGAVGIQLHKERAPTYLEPLQLCLSRDYATLPIPMSYLGLGTNHKTKQCGVQIHNGNSLLPTKVLKLQILLTPTS